MNNTLTSLTWVEFACKYSVVRRHRQPSSGPGLRRCVPAEAPWSSVNLFASESLPVTLVSVCVPRLQVSVHVQDRDPASSCPTNPEAEVSAAPFARHPSCLPISARRLPVKLRLADLAGLLSSIHPSPFLAS